MRILMVEDEKYMAEAVAQRKHTIKLPRLPGARKKQFPNNLGG